MALEVRLLGPPQVTRDGAPVAFETRKAMALLAHLAVAGRPRSRAALCELLYPDSEPEKARGALRRTLSGLRTRVGEEWITVVGDSVALERRSGLEVDVERFRAIAARDDAGPEELAEAVALFGGGFLEGFSLRDSTTFDDWQIAIAGELDRELSGVLGRLVDGLAARGEIAAAITQAQRLLALDPLHEPTHRRLIRLYAWSGDRAAAFEQYRSCVRTLSEELGVSPVEDTTALYEQVSDGTLEAPAAAPAPEPARAGSAEKPEELPLVGRAAELDALLDAYAAADPDGGLVVIEGEAGIGKTRLAGELVPRARADGKLMLTATCYDDEAALPYAPVVDLLRQAAAAGLPREVSPQHLANAGALVPEIAPANSAAQSGPGLQTLLLEGVAAVIGARPGVVLVDDAHAADQASLDVLAYLSRRLTGRSVLLVLTWRTEAVPPGHRLRKLVADLARGGRSRTIAPSRLGPEDVAGLVHEALPGSDDALADRVQEESEGLPLFVSEYVAAVRDGGGAEFAGGLLDARLAGLDDVARQVLGTAATIGRSFDVATLRHAGGRSDEETVEAVEQLVAHGLIRDVGTGYDFSHGKLRELAYERTGVARRRLLHARVAEALARRPRGGEHALVAHHLGLAGDDAGAAEHHLAAADHAVSVHAHAEGVAHLEAALAHGHPDTAAVCERMADSLTLLGDYAGALARLETAAALAPRPALEHKIGRVLHRRGEWDRARARFEAALAQAPPDGTGAIVRADLSRTLHSAGDSARSRVLAREALELAEAAGDARAEAQAHNLLGVLDVSEGDPGAGRDHIRAALCIAEQLGDTEAEIAALNNLALIERDAGSLDAAVDLTERALALCARFGDRHREAALENNLADLHHSAGREAEAMDHLKRAVAIFSEVSGAESAPRPEIWKLVSW